MSQQSINSPKIDFRELRKLIPNRFVLSLAIAKRAKQLKDGIKPLVEYDPDQQLDYVGIAMKEILEKKVDPRFEEDSEDEEVIKEMDNLLDDELKKEDDSTKDGSKADKKKESKKSKSKSKSLAA